MRRRPIFAVLLLLLFAPLPSAMSQLITEQIDVRVVNVDVVVTDRQGHRLPGLTRDDFQLFEDGKPVEIAYFSRYADGRMELDRPSATDDGPALTASPRTPT